MYKILVIYPCHKFTVPNGKFRTTTFYIFIHNAICDTIWMIHNYKIIIKKKTCVVGLKKTNLSVRKLKLDITKKKNLGNIFKIKKKINHGPFFTL